jgi:hypothetical protein
MTQANGLLAHLNPTYVMQWFDVAFEQLQDRILQGTNDDSVIIVNNIFNIYLCDQGRLTFDHEGQAFMLGKRVVVEEHAVSLWRVVKPLHNGKTYKP